MSTTTAPATATGAPPAPPAITQADRNRIDAALNTALRRLPPGGGPGGPGGPGGGGGGGGLPGAPGGGGPPGIPPAQLVPIPAAADLKQLGTGPTVFEGDRQLADAFVREIGSYFRANKGVPGFNSPLRKVAIALTYIKGPRVDGWADDMAVWLDSLHPVNDNYDYIWERFLQSFEAQFQDSAKQQRARMMLDTITFKFPEIDQYIANFEDLARKAGYTVGNDETVSLFLRGLRSSPDVFE